MEFSHVYVDYYFFVFVSLLVIININGIHGSHDVFMNIESVSPVNVREEHRTAYHFQPPKNWINDPNGPMYYNGVYHLFYQYNPKGAIWGNTVWAHSVSKDLISWIGVEPAISPSKPFDKYGCWSGSATIVDKKPVILYTGIVDKNKTQVQNYAIPMNISDPYLRYWIKPNDNPLIVPDESINKTTFRDPTTAWFDQDNRWRIVIGGLRNNRGMTYLYRSKDFKHWIKAKHPLHSVAGTGNFECPDFYPVSINGENGLDTSIFGNDVKHVMKVSLDLKRYDYYTIGTYDHKRDTFTPDKSMVDGWNGLRYDYGNFYASKSFYDPSKKRRILWGWANESDTIDNDIQKGWAGIQSIPRTLILDPNGRQLLQWPISEVEKLRTKKVELTNKDLSNGEYLEILGITAAQADIDVNFVFDNLENAEPFDPSWNIYDAQKICNLRDSTFKGGLGPFGLLALASEKLEEYTPIFFRIFKNDNEHLVLLCSDASRSTLMSGKSQIKGGTNAYRPSFAGFVDVDLKQNMLSLRSLIDHSVVESFGASGKMVITSRVYPTLAIFDKAHLYAFNNGSEIIRIQRLTAWSMRRPLHMNQ